MINEDFPKLPADFKGIYRYVNGRIYVMSESRYYEYDEVRNIVTNVGNNDLKIIGIACINRNIIETLQNGLKYLLSFYGK